MTKPKIKKKRATKTKENKQSNSAVPILRVRKGATLKEIYAAARRAFTAADLQKYTEIEEGIPAEQVLAEMEAINREETRKRKMRGAPPPRRQESKMAKKRDPIPRLKVPKNATLREIYAQYRKQFTAADLQKYTEIEPMVPLEQVIAEMEKIHQQETRKRRKK